MRISYLELKNYRKFRDLRLQLPDGVIGILGLNGAGKTTIIEGVAWCLFGNVDEVVRTNKESIRRLGTGKTESVSVVLEFDLEGTEYRLEREMGGRNLSMKALLRSRGEIVAEGDRAVRSKVNELIGMDHKSFFTSVFARQKELNELQNFTPAERKKVVLRMLRIDNVDTVIQSVREDRRHAAERVKGAETIILDANGADREDVIQSKLKCLGEESKEITSELKNASERIATLSRKHDETRKRRDALKKETDEYGAVSADLRAKRSTITEQRSSEQNLARKIRDTEDMLSRLPDLEASEKEWERVAKVKEALDESMALHDKRERIRAEIVTLNGDIANARKEVDRLDSVKEEERQILGRIEGAEAERRKSESDREELSRAITGLEARVSERRTSLSKERKKLDDIETAGEEGACPTCERALGETYDVIVKKLRGALESADQLISDDEKKASEMRSKLETARRKLEALDRKVQHQEEKLAATREKIASTSARAEEIARLEKRVKERAREVEEIGDTKYSVEEHQAAKSSLARLQKSHDDLVKLLERQRQLGTMKNEREAVRKAMGENEASEKGLAERAKVLEPKKRLYEESIREFDESYEELGVAKDAATALTVERDRIKAESDSARREMDMVREQKRMIASEKTRVDDLGTLEETLVGFKDHLIGKVAPALAETTSEILGLMTDGKYERVQLDEDYQISVDDDGVLHPLDRFSGGEADLANLSLRLAISRIIAERASTSQMNFLILDEIFGSLDPHRKRSVMAALSGLSSQFRQVMLISHVEEVKDLMTTVVRVEELPDGTSTAKIVS